MTQAPPKESSNNDDSVAALLIPRHYAHIKAINERDWETLAKYQWHIAPDFTADIMYSESVKSWADYISAFRELTSGPAPDFHISVLDVNVSIRGEGRTKAEVYLLATEEGRVPGVLSHGMSNLEWRKEIVGGKTEWVLCSHTMFRGVTEAFGF